MKNLKKILAVVLAMVLMAAMSVTMFAENMGSNGTVETSANSITLKKNITVTNYSGYAYEPTITYTYQLKDGPAAAANKTVTDDSEPAAITASFKQGLASYLAAGDAAVKTAAYSSANAVSGNSTVRELTWTFDPAKFPSAGVYRFIIEETGTSVAPASIGIVRSADFDAAKFLDVYVKNGDAGLAIYGYALVDDEASAVTPTSAKSDGWDTGDDLDSYTTYNITITKTITGAGADMTAKFPFTVNLSGEMSNANIAVDDTALTPTEGTETAADTAIVTKDLGNGDTIVIKGLPTTVSYTVAEANPTPDKYTATVNVTGGTSTAVGGDLAALATSLNLVTDGTLSGTSEITVNVTNNLDLISPTGVILRIAPFAIILLAGIVLFVVARRRRVED